ncbi:MAG TPA: phosphatidylglycerophosphatase A [Saprospiraceae bacterium]|nr:phosphatidylglycerophosphatase A [Saprospiraceae bacterium]
MNKVKNYKLEKTLASFFGLGFLPYAPGTWGTIGGMVISCLFILMKFELWDIHYIHLFLIIISYGIGVYVSERLEEVWGHDSSKIVIDEVMGIWVAILFLPVLNLYYLLAAFVLFRFFDIVKPLGIKILDRMKTSHSVMLDDFLAGVYTNIILQTWFYLMT